MLCLLPKLTAYSQVTCIPDSTKREIAKTLLDYPLVLEELRLSKEVIAKKNEAISNLNEQHDLKDYVIKTYRDEITNLLDQKRLYQNELEKRKSGGFVYGMLNLNGWTSYGGGFDYVFKMKLIAGANVQYDTFYQNTNINLKVGFKVF